MRTLPRVALTFVVLQALASTAAWACKCESPDETPEELLAAHGQVFVGEVLEVPRSCGFGGNSAETVSYTLVVTEAFKGVATGDEVTIETASSGPACGIELSEGESLLVYTSDGRVSSCDPGGPAEEEAEAIEALRSATGE